MGDVAPRLSAAGIGVQVEEGVPAATLRYFSPGGAFAGAVQEITGYALPERGRLVGSTGLLLAWRSPTETLCVAQDEAPLEDLARRLAQCADGQCLELTGALVRLHVSGERVADLMYRLGGTQSLPSLGEARRSRMADIAVLALCERPDTVQLLIDRGYTEHLCGWIRETLLDMP